MRAITLTLTSKSNNSFANLLALTLPASSASKVKTILTPKYLNNLKCSFVNAVKQIFEKRGKISGKVQMDLNFFMIYYVFPAILMTQNDNAKLMADTLCETWGKSFKDSKIGYTDYDTLYESFKEKIFGIF